MARPQRIEYENALYHVMNRGRGRQTIFHGEEYYQDFLLTLSEAHERFSLRSKGSVTGKTGTDLFFRAESRSCGLPAALAAKGLLLKERRQRLRLKNPLGPTLQLIRRGLVQPLQGPVGQGAEAFAE